MRTFSALLLSWLAGCAGGGALPSGERQNQGDPQSQAGDPTGAGDGADLAHAAAPDLGAAPDLANPPSPPPPPVAKLLDVAWQGQQTYYFCGPGSTRMALSTRTNTPPSQQTLASYMGTMTNGTDDVSLVRNALNHYLGTTWFEVKYLPDPPSQAQRDKLKADLVYNIDHGYPLVANVVSGWRPPGYPGGTIYHYVAVVGYDASGDRALIADPAGDCAGGSSWCNVPRTYWISTVDLGTWIGGKGYTA